MSDLDTWSANLDFVTDSPSVLRQLVAGLVEPTVRQRPSPDEFSAVEQVCHLRDLEIEGYGDRIRRILVEETPRLDDFDGARVAAERAYNNEAIESALNAFSEARTANLAVLRSLTEKQKARTGELAGVGEVNIPRLLAMMREHDEGHLDELRSLRRWLLA